MNHPTWSADRQSGVSVVLNLKFPSYTAEHWTLVTADRHWDHPHSDRVLQKKHLDQALKRSATIFDFGDFFCGMQLPFDKRGTKGSTRAEHEHFDYIDRMIVTAADWLKPYAKLFAVMCTGNHETSILKRTTSNLTDRLAVEINRRGGRVVPTSYRGYIRVIAKVSTLRSGRLIYYTHGSGGAAPVTRGVIAAERRAADYPDADYIVSGHTHHNWVWPIPKHRLSNTGVERVEKQYHIQVPSYKQALANNGGGWEHEKGFRPLATGAYWIRWTLDRERRLQGQIMEADG